MCVLFIYFGQTTSKSVTVNRGAATDSGPPGQHIHLGPPAFRGGEGEGVGVGGGGYAEGYPPL